MIKAFCSLLVCCAVLVGSLDAIDKEPCTFLEPLTPIEENPFFQEMAIRSQKSSETFRSLFTYFKEHEKNCYRYQFKYPLKDEAGARLFAKTLSIQAQIAHRFLPGISFCQFLAPSHLGFTRKITTAEGITSKEYVVLDSTAERILIAEEFSILPNGDIATAAAASFIRIIKEEGLWYFAGTYLYKNKPSQEKINEAISQFKTTYENMVFFIEKEDVNAIHSQLQK